jgi:hypothetical protein
VKKARLFNLKEWLTIEETAQYLDSFIEEDVNEAMVYRLALDKLLRLSVSFSKIVVARKVQIVSMEEAKQRTMPYPVLPGDSEEHVGKQIKIPEGIPIGGNKCLEEDEELTIIDGIWELPMIGAERTHVENIYHELINGSKVSRLHFLGSFVTKDDNLYQLQDWHNLDVHESDNLDQTEGLPESLALMSIIKNVERHNAKTDSKIVFHPASKLPEHCLFVVRREAINEFQSMLLEELEKEKPINKKAETSYQNIIGALLKIIMGKNCSKDFETEEELKNFIVMKFDGLQGISERAQSDKFKAAKANIKEVFGDFSL